MAKKEQKGADPLKYQIMRKKIGIKVGQIVIFKFTKLGGIINSVQNIWPKIWLGR